MVLVPLGLGIIIGIFFTARLIGKLLKNNLRQVNLVMLGLLPGSVFVMLKDLIANESGFSEITVLAGFVSFCAGAVLSFVTTKAQGKLPGRKER